MIPIIFDATTGSTATASAAADVVDGFGYWCPECRIASLSASCLGEAEVWGQAHERIHHGGRPGVHLLGGGETR